MGYESEVQKAMEYVFGGTLVCNNMDNAKKVTFDKSIMTKTVTLGGDTFDPQGTLTGGKLIVLLYHTLKYCIEETSVLTTQQI